MEQTLAFLLARQPLCTMQFAGTIASSSTYLPGAGNIAGDGFPLPFPGYLQQIFVWNGSLIKSDTDEIALASGDRLSLYCTWTGTDFTVRARLNGANTNLMCTAIAQDATITVTLAFSQEIA